MYPYIGTKSITERPSKTKIGTEGPTSHVTVTRTPLSRSKGQRSTYRGGAYCGGLPHSLLKIKLSDRSFCQVMTMTLQFPRHCHTISVLVPPSVESFYIDLLLSAAARLGGL